MKLTIFLATCLFYMNMVEGKTFLIETKDKDPTSAVTEDNMIDEVDADTEEDVQTVDEDDDDEINVDAGKYDQDFPITQ